MKWVNTGVGVTITTHSDTMVQHFNNMIKLKSLANRDELMKQYGFEVPTFNDALDKMLDEAYAFQEDEADGKSKLTWNCASDSTLCIPTRGRMEWYEICAEFWRKKTIFT